MLTEKGRQKMMLDVETRPGDFEGNAARLHAAVRAALRAGAGAVEIPADALRGGSCGSLDEHPAFQRALAAAQRRFEKRLPKKARVSYVVRPRPEAPVASDPCADPRRPFNAPADAIFAVQTRALAARLRAIGCKHVVLGLSGGLDSTLALLVAVAAFDALHLDKGGIHVLTMPCFGTTRRTKNNAVRLAEALGLAVRTVPLAAAVRQHLRLIGHDGRTGDVTYENAQARMRTLVLMDVANHVGGIVLGTGDMSEIALGWCTYNGDHMSMFGINAGVPKTVVRQVCSWWAAQNPGPAAAIVQDVVATPVSPELLPASAAGEILQKTEDKIGPYELHDFFLWHFVHDGEGRAEILRAARAAFRGVYDAKTIARWLDLFFRRFFAQAFKRNCAPDGIRVFAVYLSPRGFWIPSDAAPVDL